MFFTFYPTNRGGENDHWPWHDPASISSSSTLSVDGGPLVLEVQEPMCACGV